MACLSERTPWHQPSHVCLPRAYITATTCSKARLARLSPLLHPDECCHLVDPHYATPLSQQCREWSRRPLLNKCEMPWIPKLAVLCTTI